MPSSLLPATARVTSASSVQTGSSSGVRSAIAARWRSTVPSSPRAIGPVSAASGPSRAHCSAVARTSGASCARVMPVVAARRSAQASSATRKLAAIAPAAW